MSVPKVNIQQTFEWLSALKPPEIGYTVGDLLKTLERRSETHLAQSAYTDVLAALHLPPGHPMAMAGHEIARRIDNPNDADNFGGWGNGYHNQKHMLEVMVCAGAMIALHERSGLQPQLSDDDKLLLITAALSHDVGHNGKGNGKGAAREQFLTELHSWKLVEPIIRKAYVTQGDDPEETLPKFKALLMATDIHGGPDSPWKYFIEAAKFHRGEIDDFEAPPEYKSLLLGDPAFAELGCVLQDADILTSIAMRPEISMSQQMNFAQEDPSQLDANGGINWAGMIWFHENLASLESQVGKRDFMDNFQIIKDFARQMKTIFLAGPPQPTQP